MAGSGCLRGERQRPRRPQWGEALGSRSGSRHGSGSVPRRHPAGSQGTTYRLRQPRARWVAVPAQPFIASSRQRSHRVAAPLAPAPQPLSRTRSRRLPLQSPPRGLVPLSPAPRPVLRTLLRCEGCGGRVGKPPRWSGQQSRGRGVGAGCWVLHDRALGSLRPRAGEVQPGDTVAGRASLSPVEIKHRMGMGGGVWQRPGLDWGVPPVPAPGGLRFSAAPTYQGLHSAVARVGRRGSEAPAVATLGPQRHREA